MKKIKVVVLTLILVLTLTGCGDKEEATITYDEIQNKEVNITNEEISKEYVIEGIKITDTKVVYSNGISTLTSKVENISNEEITLSKLKAHITYGENNVVIEIDIYIGESLGINESKNIKTSVDVRLDNVTKIEYEIVK